MIATKTMMTTKMKTRTTKTLLRKRKQRACKTNTRAGCMSTNCSALLDLTAGAAMAVVSVEDANKDVRGLVKAQDGFGKQYYLYTSSFGQKNIARRFPHANFLSRASKACRTTYADDNYD